MPPHTTASALVGRDAELVRLREQFRNVVEGQAGATLISGEAGIGKSRLVRDLAGLVQNQADVLVGHCIDLGRAATPYGPITEVLRALVEVRGVDEVMAVFGPDQLNRTALLLLLPELADPEHHDLASNRHSEELGPEQLVAAIMLLLRAAGERTPLVIVIEDLHWADEGTLTVLTALLRRIVDSRVMVVVTMRDDGHRSDPARRFAVESVRARVLESLPLSRLRDDEVRAMVAGLVDRALDPGTFEQLLERSEGVPFFIEELVENASAPLEDTIRDVLLARYDRLSDTAASLVRTMSVSQSTISDDMLVRLVRLPEEQLNLALREAIDAGIISLDESDHYSFRHALLREAVRSELLPGERTKLNRELAELLQQTAESGTREAPFAALAYHWEQAKEPEKSFIASIAAMRQAASKYAYAAAAHFGEQALGYWDEVDAAEEKARVGRIAFIEELSLILRDAGRTNRGLAIIELGLEEVQTRHDPVARASLLRQKAESLSYLGLPGREPLIMEALEALGAGNDNTKLRAHLYNLLASTQMRSGDYQDAIESATAALEYSRLSDDRSQQSIAYNLRGSSLATSGRVREGLADYEKAIPLATSGNSRMWTQANYSDLLNIIGRYRDAVKTAEAGLAITQRYGVERTTGVIMMQNLLEPLLELGDIGRVEELLALGVDAHAVRMQRVYMLSSRVRALSWRGRAEEAQQLLHEWNAPLRQAAKLERQVWYAVLLMETSIAIARDDFAAARAAIERMLHDTGNPAGNQRRLLLEAAWIVAECRARGEDVAELANSVLDAWDAQSEELRDLDCERVLTGLLMPTASSMGEALTSASMETVPKLFEVIVRVEQIRHLIASGERAKAIEVVRETQPLSARLSYEPLEKRVGELARALGLGQNAGAAGEDSILTSREQQVLDLVAEGLSNREIGEKLYISIKTVSVHVSSVLRKLGVSTRTQAARSPLVTTRSTHP